MKGKVRLLLIVSLILFQIVGSAAGLGQMSAPSDIRPIADSVQPSAMQLALDPSASGELSHHVILDLSRPQADGVVLDGSNIRIEKGGVYALSGTLTGGIVVSCPGPVHLVLSGVAIDNPDGAAIYFDNCTDAGIEVAENSQNVLSGGKKQNDESDKAKGKKGAKGTIYAAMPLTISGGGTLSIMGSKHGVACKGALAIQGCTLVIQADSDGINADGDVTIQGGSLFYTGGGDGVQSGAGVSIDSGSLSFSAQGDGIKCKAEFTLQDGSVVMAGECNEGIQSGTKITLLGGSLDITSRDDPINAQSEIVIAGGRHLLKGGNDGLDSNGRLLITGGITVAYGTAPNYGADCNDNPFVIEGGILVACGENNTQPSSDTTQGTLLIANAKPGLLAIEADKEPVLLLMLPREYASVLVSAPGIEMGRSYAVTTGGQGEGEDLLDSATPYTAGEYKREITMDSLVYPLTLP